MLEILHFIAREKDNAGREKERYSLKSLSNHPLSFLSKSFFSFMTNP